MCCPAEKRYEWTKMAALRVVLHEQESKRMKRTKEIEEEVRGEEECVEYEKENGRERKAVEVWLTRRRDV